MEVAAHVGSQADRLADRGDVLAEEGRAQHIVGVPDPVLRHVERHAEARETHELPGQAVRRNLSPVAAAGPDGGLLHVLAEHEPRVRRSKWTAYRP